MPIKVTTQCLTLFYIIYLFFRNDKRNELATQDTNTDHTLASYIQYEQNPITNQNIKKLKYKGLIFSEICQPDATKV